MKHSRRVILLGLGVGLGGWWVLRPDTPREGLQRLLARLLSHFDVAPDAIPTFVRAYLDLEGDFGYRDYEQRRRRLSFASRDARIAAFEENLVSRFLLSTTYFQFPDLPVKWVRLMDPYTSGCANPFARFD
jgi:hypothetical protein